MPIHFCEEGDTILVTSISAVTTAVSFIDDPDAVQQPFPLTTTLPRLSIHFDIRGLYDSVGVRVAHNRALRPISSFVLHHRLWFCR